MTGARALLPAHFALRAAGLLTPANREPALQRSLPNEDPSVVKLVKTGRTLTAAAFVSVIATVTVLVQA